jgi:uncharacterized membrane protein YqaE (UPF0057 family)
MRKIIQIVTLAIVGIALVSSCTVEKRLHTRGMSISWNSNWKKQQTKVEKEQLEAPIYAQNQDVIQENTTLDQPILNKEVVASQNELHIATESTQEIAKSEDVASVANELPTKKSSTWSTSKNHQAATSNVLKSPKTFAKIQAKETTNRVNGGGGGKASGGLLVLYIILCLFPFINLIPVYLTDGSVTLNFWVTLILDILGALPGIIFALLVVLGVVSL